MSDIAFLGGGNMASAIAHGITNSLRDLSLSVYDKNTEKLNYWTSKGVLGFLMPNEELSESRLWILAVKPQNMKELCESITPFIQPDTLILSVAAGITTSSISKWLCDHTSIIRCMPNTPSTIGIGATAVYARESVSKRDLDFVLSLLSTIGTTEVLNDEGLLDAVTGLSGSGPAYVYYFLESLIEGGIGLGLTKETAKSLAIQTVIGATQLAQTSEDSIARLRENVTSKGGTTKAALDILKKNNFKNIVIEAMKAAKDRAAELSKEFK